MASKDTDFVVYWESGGSNQMSARELSGFPIDAASWAAFLGLLMGKRTHAAMTMHSPQAKLKVKVIPIKRVTIGMDYATIV